MNIDGTLALAAIRGLGILSPCLGLVAYRQLVEHYRRLPAVAAEPRLVAEVALLERKRADLEREVAELQQRMGELNGIKGEAEYWRAQVEATRQEMELLGPRRLELGQVSQQLADAQEKLARVEAGHAGLRAAVEELGARRDGLEASLAKLGEEKKGLLAELESLLPQRAALRQQLEADRAALADAQARMLAAETQLRHADGQLRELVAARSTATQELERLQQQKAALEAAQAGLTAQLEALGKRKAEAEAELTALVERQRQLRAGLDAVEGQRQQAEARIRELEGRRAKLETTVAALESTLKALESTTISLTPEREGSPGPDDDPLHELRGDLSPFRPALRAVPALEELQALDRLRGHLAASGLQFAERTLLAFHTCLKIADISPLTVLAGISGTGKSALPRHYAEALGLEFLMVPVQPRWDGPQDLLGFYNYLEKRFKATDLSRMLVRLDPENWGDLGDTFADRVVLVLLDEMNLARVEYYFSDFLSLLEIRRDAPERAEVRIDLGHKQRPLRLAPNALFVGTMNEDESTQSLSDKVLDRANLLRFARPKSFEQPPAASAVAPLGGFLPKRVWDGWRRDRASLPAAARRDLDGWVKELNLVLDRLGRPFGHRVQQAILAYAANHPGVASGRGSLAGAFVDQLEQRILPKLRGLDTSSEGVKAGLEDLAALVQRIAPDDQPLRDALDRARDQPLFVWAGAQRDA